MDVNERLVALLVSRADRMNAEPTVDRHTVRGIPAAPPRALPKPASEPTSPWEAARAQICTHGVIDATRSGEQLLEALLTSSQTTPEEIRALLERPGVSDRQRVRILTHPQAPGELVVAYLLDQRHDTTLFTREAMQEQLTMLQGVAGISGTQRLDAWAALLVRVSAAPATLEHTSNVLMTSPNASAVLHAGVALAVHRYRQINPALGRHLVSHMSTPATVALLPFGCLFRLLGEGDDGNLSTERISDLFCDMVSACCGTQSRRWERFFKLAPRWEGSIGDLLDDIESDAGEVASATRQRRSVPGYQRPSNRSPLLRPIDYSTLRAGGSAPTAT